MVVHTKLWCVEGSILQKEKHQRCLWGRLSGEEVEIWMVITVGWDGWGRWGRWQSSPAKLQPKRPGHCRWTRLSLFMAGELGQVTFEGSSQLKRFLKRTAEHFPDGRNPPGLGQLWICFQQAGT